MVRAYATSNILVRLLVSWCGVVMIFGLVAIERPIELKQQPDVNSSIMPVGDFFEPTVQQVEYRESSANPQSRTLSLWSFHEFVAPSSFGTNYCRLMPAEALKTFSLLLLGTLLRL